MIQFVSKKIVRLEVFEEIFIEGTSEHYNIKEGTHRALSDVSTLREVYKTLIRDLSK